MSLAEIRKRNEKLRAEGKLPGAKGTGTSATVPALAPKRAPLKVVACAHLGVRIGHSCGSILRRCERHGDITTQLTQCKGANRFCQTCPDYAPA